MRTRTGWPWMACIALLGACGDNFGSPPDAALPPDAELPGPDAGPPAPDAGTPATAFVVAGDYMGTGVASTIALPERTVTENVVAGVASGDPVVRYQDGRIYITNRFGSDNVTVLDADDYSLIAQISTGAGSNPQDVAARGNTLYVAALNAPGILVLDLERPGDGVIQTIDLSALDANDGIPDCGSVYLVEDTLYATCGLLQSFAAVVPGKVAMVDATSNTFTGSVDLETRNPVSLLHAAPAGSALAGDLLVATVVFGELTTGCIERIRTGDTPGAGCLIQNQVLGGYASDIAAGADDTLYIGLIRGYDGSLPDAVMTSYDLGSNTLRPAPLSPAGQRIFDVAWCPGDILLGADAESGGIRVYAADGSELTTAVLDVGLPPVANGMVCY
jgi:YVTN family beta-propeller protein